MEKEKFEKSIVASFSHSQNQYGELVVPVGSIDAVYIKLDKKMQFASNVQNDTFRNIYDEHFKPELDKILENKNMLKDIEPKFHLTGLTLEEMTKDNPKIFLQVVLNMVFTAVEEERQFSDVDVIDISIGESKLIVFSSSKGEIPIPKVFFGCINPEKDRRYNKKYENNINKPFDNDKMKEFGKNISKPSPEIEVITINKAAKKMKKQQIEEVATIATVE
jgi:hypothetical protein